MAVVYVLTPLVAALVAGLIWDLRAAVITGVLVASLLGPIWEARRGLGFTGAMHGSIPFRRRSGSS